MGGITISERECESAKNEIRPMKEEGRLFGVSFFPQEEVKWQ